MILSVIISCVNTKTTENIRTTDNSNLTTPSDSSYIDTTKGVYDNNIVLNASLIRTYDTTIQNKDKYKAFDVKLSIINKSDKAVCFWIMTCDWRDNFVINNDYIDFLWEHACDSNCPVERCIKPNECIEYKTSLIKINQTKHQFIQTTKFGLIWIDSTQCKTTNDYGNIMGDKSKQDRMLWSNSLYLNDKQ